MYRNIVGVVWQIMLLILPILIKFSDPFCILFHIWSLLEVYISYKSGDASIKPKTQNQNQNNWKYGGQRVG